MTHYNDAVLPETIRFGSATDTRFSVQQLFPASGFRKVNEVWSEPLRQFRLQYKRKLIDGVLLNRFYESMGGPTDSFLLRDWAFWNTGVDQRVGGDALVTNIDEPLINPNTNDNLADGTTTVFQTHYTASAGSASRTYRLRHPVSSGFVCAFDGTDCTAFVSSVNEATGEVTFSEAPPFGGSPNSAAMTWGGVFRRAGHFVNPNLTEIFRNFELHAFDLLIQEAKGV